MGEECVGIGSRGFPLSDLPDEPRCRPSLPRPVYLTFREAVEKQRKHTEMMEIRLPADDDDVAGISGSCRKV